LGTDGWSVCRPQSELRADGEDLLRGDREDCAVAKRPFSPVPFFVVKEPLKVERGTPSIAKDEIAYGSIVLNSRMIIKGVLLG